MTLKIDSTKFSIEAVYWFDGDDITFPGYQIIIKVSGQETTHLCSLWHPDREIVNIDWIIDEVDNGGN